MQHVDAAARMAVVVAVSVVAVVFCLHGGRTSSTMHHGELPEKQQC